MQVAGAVGAYALQILSGVAVTAPVPSTFDWHGTWKVEAWLRVVRDSVPSIGCIVHEVYKYPSSGGIAICDENGYSGGASASDCTGSWFRIPHECNTLAANTDPILANVYRDGALLYENINLDINLDGLGANTVDVGGKSGTKNDEDWKIGDFIVWPEHDVSAALQGRPESPVLYFVDSVLELSETMSSAIPGVLTSAIDPGLGPNLARACSAGNCPVTGSTRYPCEPACPLIMVNNGEYDAYTRQTHEANQGWIQIDFEIPVAIRQVRVWLVDSTYAIPASDPVAGHLRNNDFAIWYGNQSSTPATQGAPNINCLTYSGTPMSVEIFTCEGTARYLYLYFPAQSAAIREIEVYGPVKLGWKQIRLEHEAGFGNLAKLYVDGVELVDAGVNITALYQGGGIRMTNVVVDDLRVDYLKIRN
jgi:hypothetical protein